MSGSEVQDFAIKRKLDGAKPGKESRGDVSIKDTRIRIGRKDDLDRSQWTLASKGGEDSITNSDCIVVGETEDPPLRSSLNTSKLILMRKVQ